MCDYSLLTFPNRLAVEGEQLVSHRFPCYSIGLASPVDLEAPAFPQCGGHARDSWKARFKNWLSLSLSRRNNVPAVCIPPGARLRVHNIPPYIQKRLGIGPREDVRFSELSARPYEYRDAICLKDGRKVLLQTLGEGVHFKVLSLGDIDPESHPGEFPLTSVRECGVSIGI